MTQDLYRQVILAHYRQPANRYKLDGANVAGYSHNPLCGDEISVYARIDSGRLTEASFEARGCSIVQASADMMADCVRGQTRADLDATITAFESMLEGPDEEPDVALGDLRLLREVRKFPVRIKCALLPWKTLRDALGKSNSQP
ncbi:MAG: SUF system NifU family Fe-S cluster assembly protein [Chloroflexi bacterium]|nr:SUF system NifU family Fe-S cluster assembly protein [Chloroflexota bacterium]